MNHSAYNFQDSEYGYVWQWDGPASTDVGFLETAALVVSVRSMPSMPSECSHIFCRRVWLSMPTMKLPPEKKNNWNCPRAKSKLRNGYIYICMNTVGWARPSFCPSMVTPWTTLPHQRVVNVPSRSSTLEEATVSSTFLKHFSRDKELAY